MEGIVAQPTLLRQRWDAYREQNLKARTRDAARALGVAESQLLSLNCGNGVTRLAGDWRELLKRFEGLGYIMALTRNEHAVHEKKGIYRNVSFEANMGMALDKDIDLRLFMGHWANGFAVEEDITRGKRYSFHFFDQYGEALHKVYLQSESSTDFFKQLRDEWRSTDQTQEERVLRKPEPEAPLPDDEIDRNALREDWEKLTNTHEFVRLLKKHRIARTQALRLAGRKFAQPVDHAVAHRFVLQRASETRTPIMVFTGSPGCVQIHTGEVHRLLATEAWFNVLDPTFNLHLRERGIAESWIVRKPTSDGIVTSLELYDEHSKTIALFFGSRKETVVENPAWREIIGELSEDKSSESHSTI